MDTEAKKILLKIYKKVQTIATLMILFFLFGLVGACVMIMNYSSNLGS